MPMRITFESFHHNILIRIHINIILMYIENFFIKYIWLIMQHCVIIILHLKNYGQYISSYQFIFIQIGEISRVLR